MKINYLIICCILFFGCTNNNQQSNEGDENHQEVIEGETSKNQEQSFSLKEPVSSGDPLLDIKMKFKVINDAISNGKLNKDSISYECPDYPEGGTLLFYKDNGEIRKIVRNYYAGDHGGETIQYYAWNDELFFQFSDESYWMFDAGNRSEDEMSPNTVDHFTEMRYYFEKGEIIKCLEKKFEYRTALKNNPKSNEVSNKEVECNNAEELMNDFKKLLALEKMNMTDGDCIWDFIGEKD